MAGRPTVQGTDYLLNLMSGGAEPVSAYYVAAVLEDSPSYTTYGGELDEPLAADYGRAVLENVSGSWYVNQGTMSNYAEIAFPIAATAWGLVRHWAICDDPIAGRALFVGDLDNPFEVGIGDQWYIPVGGLEISFPTSLWRVWV
jgi:hypothetical protein